ncbi:5' exonuclease Apollo [Canna indica]|uniref:Protein artemis n=1 Tax=Canna indica TaxID=4628 RepID=A0AAQ3Q0N4_9LILI|nr:5' exonuclease Apollo [Canna indica]
MEKGLVSVDQWTVEGQAYFLTHLHADHTRGLSAAWRRGPLFCSPISARLFPAKFPGFDLSLLRVLEVGATRALDLVSPTTGSRVQILVTPIDAHHCPGAVMYLFHGAFGLVLYTGDFRWESSSKRAELAKKMLLDALQGNTVDVLYMDNTYCHPSLSFPPRHVAAQQVIDIITMHPDHEIIIGIDNLGKEDLLVHISKALCTKVWVWPERLQTMHLLGYDNIFTTNTSVTRVRAVPRYSLTFETLDALNTMHPTIGILPSGLPWALDLSKKKGFLCTLSEKNHSYEGSVNQLHKNQMHLTRKLKQNAYSVPYSEHSCFSEIEEFVKLVQPSILSRIVPSTFCYINPRYYFSRYCIDIHPSDEPSSSKSDKAEDVDTNEKNGTLQRCKSFIKVKARELRKAKYARGKLGIRSRTYALLKTKRGAKIMDTDEMVLNSSL